MPEPTPTVATIHRRLRYKLDGSSGARCRAVGPDGRPVRYTARRASVAATALRWRALGYDDVQIALATVRSAQTGRMDVNAFRPYPASQDEAIQAVRELAAQRSPFASQWRRFLRRLERTTTTTTPNPPNEGDQT